MVDSVPKAGMNDHQIPRNPYSVFRNKIILINQQTAPLLKKELFWQKEGIKFKNYFQGSNPILLKRKLFGTFGNQNNSFGIKQFFWDQLSIQLLLKRKLLAP